MSTPAEPATSGMPQLDFAQWPGQIAWAIIIFAALYLVFWRLILPRLGGAIDAREDRIAGEIGEARRLRDDARAQAEAAAQEMGKARARARKIAEDAAEEVKAKAAAARADADARFSAQLAEADARIAAARHRAMGEVRAIAAGAAEAIVVRLTGVPADGATIASALPAEA
ncbi:MAG TPA: hypothetical protein VGS12_09020 [Caulobacteraceae bacterium]|nr:hypothetical protein [Caulobacteraceae bacterium]